jgi:hypothetical protein
VILTCCSRLVASLPRPRNRYEDLKRQPEHEIRRVAAFLGVAASDDVIEKTMTNSGFDFMKNQSGGYRFFRKGQVGDWARSATVSPVLRICLPLQVTDCVWTLPTAAAPRDSCTETAPLLVRHVKEGAAITQRSFLGKRYAPHGRLSC